MSEPTATGSGPVGPPQHPGAELPYRATALCVVCESYDDVATFPRLKGARGQMLGIAARLRELGFHVRVVGETEDPDLATFRAARDSWRAHWNREGGNGPALILWSGHGVLDGGQLRLALRDLVLSGAGEAGRREILSEKAVSARQLVNLALSSGADQVALVIDACHSGAALGESVRQVLDHLAETTLPPGRSKWLGVMASCLPAERSPGHGPLFQALSRTLVDGPGGSDYATAWSTHNALITGAELLAGVRSRWDEEREEQLPHRVAVGDERPAFPNPRSLPGAPPALVEHLVLAARGVGHREEGWFFTGRRRVLRQITAWMSANRPGLFLVTGPAGCGKSAVLGRIATLAVPEQRAELGRQGALGDAGPQARERGTFAAAHLRGLTAAAGAAELAAQLGLPAPANVDAFLASLADLPSAPVIALDGLDEVPAAETRRVVEDLVFPLSRRLPLLVGSRERAFRAGLAGGESLPESLVRHIGDAVTRVDLADEEDTRDDIAGYVRRRCEAAGVDGTGVAEALADRATRAEGGFLFARLVTGFLISRLSAADRTAGDRTDPAALVDELPGSVTAAFEEDLRTGPVLVGADGTAMPDAARHLLTALAWAAGRGMPAGGVWESAASALAGLPPEHGYDERDIDQLLSAYGRYVVEDSADGQAVYRLYHREFVEHLQAAAPAGAAEPAHRVLVALVGLLRRQVVVGDWTGADPYLRSALAAHALAAGCPGPGLDTVRELVARDEENALPHLAGLLREAGAQHWMLGGRADALALWREAVEHHERLVETGGDDRTVSDLAGCLSVYSLSLAETGNRQAALPLARRATALLRDLAERSPAAHRPELAGALNNLAARLSETGDREGALRCSREAVALLRAFAEDVPAALADLAVSLNHLSVRLAETGQHAAALRYVRQAVDTFRRLDAGRPDGAHRPEFASALNNLSVRLAASGDPESALPVALEATVAWSVLARQNPAYHLPALAMALTDLSVRLGESGNRADALDPARTAVDIRRALVAENPAANRADLASSLNTLASHMALTGDRTAALDPAREVARLYRDLAEENPAVHLPDLAMSLGNLANHSGNVGDLRGARQLAREATSLYRGLAEENPALHLPDLSRALDNLAGHLAKAGNQREALAPSRESVAIRRALAAENPDAHLPELGSSLTNLANHLAEAADPQAALLAVRESLGIHRELVAKNPAAHHPGLALCLDNLALKLAGAGDPRAALAPAHEAADIWRALVAEAPAAHLPDLAMSLNALAGHVTASGDHARALDLCREALDIHRSLAATNPGAHLRHVASTLGNVAGHLITVGDTESALESARESVALSVTLAADEPGAHLPGLVMTLVNVSRLLATADEAVRLYTDAADRLARSHPAAGHVLALEHANFLLSRSEDGPLLAPHQDGVRRLAALLTSRDDTVPGAVLLLARQSLRAFASGNVGGRGGSGARAEGGEDRRGELEDLWRRATDHPLPPWLDLSEETLSTVSGWLAITSWEDSRAYWEDNAEVLTSEDAATALAEMSLVAPLATDHLTIRDQVLAQGPGTVFRLLHLNQLLNGWLGCKDRAASRAFLETHFDALALSDGTARAILAAVSAPDADVRLHVALLDVAREEGVAAAYSYVADRDALNARVARAVAEADADGLASMGAIEYAAHGDGLSASTHVQAALLLTGQDGDLVPESLAAAAAQARPETRTRLVTELARLSARSATAEHTELWMSLIRALSGPASAA
ncbi:tetratricopeptide repeat protein [Streptomyces sp. NPDC090306]|uniref:tetratricopeptide repeat protein n=1 Tax=Streptomyces sp. NPDC090306 TaxID=3365961 RepID=UPI0037FAEE88